MLLRRLDNPIPRPDAAAHAAADVYSTVCCITGFGGDFVATRRYRDGRLHVTLADVSGHDLHAARLAHEVHAAMDRLDDRRRNEPDWLASLNRRIVARIVDGFSAMLSVTLQPSDGGFAVTTANAAMPRPWVYRAKTGSFERVGLPQDAAPPLGALDGDAWLPRTKSFFLSGGDLLVMMSDGAVEALVGRCGSDETISRLMGKISWLGGRRLQEALCRRIRRLQSGVEPSDDYAIVVVEVPRTGKSAGVTAA